MSDHPAQAFKYDIVPYTRGQGVEVGGGQLYPHFKAPFAGMRELDFVFMTDSSLEPEICAEVLKDGGHLVSVRNGELRIRLKTAQGLADVVETRPPKSACVVRYGGFGDSIQAANVFPELKRQGYHVTVNTLPRGYEILKHDPHIDAWLIQDDDQVPNAELSNFWHVQSRKFDKYVQLSESVEGTLLAMPGRANHAWPDSVRRRELGKNYLEWTSDLAELPYRSEARFYPSEQERTRTAAWLREFSAQADGWKMGMRSPEHFTLMWCLSGSSMHKFSPHQDVVISHVLAEMPQALIVFTGDYDCKILESGWEKEPRIRCTSGEIGIRETLTLAQQVQCVVGPETGVLNAAAFEDNGKVVMLSHSSHENLTKHWINAQVLQPQDTACYPCHRLHYGRAWCPEDEASGAALCQKNIAPEAIFAAIAHHYADWQQMRKLRA